MASKLAKEGNTETEILLNVFPKEIWQLVLRNVHLPDEYTRIANSSPAFKSSWLVPHWNRIIFPTLLEFLDNCLGYHTPEGKHDLLNLRLVCRAWIHEVDKFLQNLPEHFLLDKELDWGHYRNDPRPKIQRAINKSVLRSFQNVTQFRTKFDASHLPQNLNPLVNRELQIWMNLDMDNFLGYAQAILSLLRNYGHQLSYFSLRVCLGIPNLDYTSLFGVGEWIREILALLPNLRTLRLTVRTDLNYFASRPPWQQKFAEMQEYWTRNEMPCFQNLSLLAEKGLPWPLLMALLAANPQLRSLESSTLAGSAISCATYEAQIPQNLQSLSICFLDIRQLEIFEAATVSWRLTKLHVLTGGIPISLARVMNIVDSKFGQTLRQLCVTWMVLPSQTPGRGAPLRMPKLETFQLCVAGVAPELDFLLPLGPTLKCLFLEMDRAVFAQNTEQEETRFLEQSRLPRESNLWNVLPKLQRFSVKIAHSLRDVRWYNVTREQWEKY